uniref:Protein kinase domain-containing protein n=1 Tax=Macrostomum lignano TaxID=282301 RepID=A0A1I8FPA1_9PLAT
MFKRVFQRSRRVKDEAESDDDTDPMVLKKKVEVKENSKVETDYTIHERSLRRSVQRAREGHLEAVRRQIPEGWHEDERESVANEIAIMKRLKHPRLLQLYDACLFKDEYVLIVELITGGELFDRIIDFGLSRSNAANLRVMFGTPEFVSPEVLAFDPVGPPADMWSVGVICYVYCVSRRLACRALSPFMGKRDARTRTSNIARVNYSFNYSEFDEISTEAKGLCQTAAYQGPQAALCFARARLRAGSALLHCRRLIAAFRDEKSASEPEKPAKLFGHPLLPENRSMREAAKLLINSSADFRASLPDTMPQNSGLTFHF